MNSVLFIEANTHLKPPSDLDESQCASIPAYVGQVNGKSCDGAPLIVVAWQPDEQELEDIKLGKPIFLSCLGGIPPHFLCTKFEFAISPR